MVALAALAVAGGLSLAEPPEPGEPGDAAFLGRNIAEVRVSGNQRVAEHVILGQVQSRPGQPFDRRQIQEDQRNIFALGRFDEVRPQAELLGQGVLLTFHVTERQRIESVEFVGVRALKPAEVQAEADISVGQVIDPSRLVMAREAVLRLYQSRGHYFADVNLEREPLEQGRVVFTIREGPQVRVGSVIFRGNNSFPAGVLQQQIETRRYMWIISPGLLDEQAVRGDVTRLLQYYRDEGFLDAQVGYTVEFSADQRRATVVFLINEGVRYTVGQISFEGNTVFAVHELRGMMLLQPGTTFRAEYQRRDVRVIRDQLYGRRGYVDAAVEILSRFADERGVVNLIVRVFEGEQVFVGRIEIVGNQVTHDRVIRRNITLEPTEPYDVLEAQQSRDRLVGTQLFERVEIAPTAIEQDGFRDVLVLVEEGRTTSFQFGAGISSDAGLLGSVTIENRNFDLFDWPRSARQLFTGQAFRGGGQTLRVVAEPGTHINRFQVQFYEPYFMDRQMSLGSNLFFFTRPRESYTETRVGYVISFGRRFRQDWTFEQAYRVELVNLSGVGGSDASDIRASSGTNLLIGGKYTLSRDTTDNRFLPTTGQRMAVSVEPVIGTAVFAKMFGSYRTYNTVRTDVYDRKSVISNRFELGAIAGDAPVFERFYAGGINTLRGFQFRGAGPTGGRDKDPVGAQVMFLAGTEYSFPLWGKSLGAFFLDTAIMEDGPRAGVGFEVRIPIDFFGSIPLTIGLAVPVIRQGGDRDQIFHFLFGTSF